MRTVIYSSDKTSWALRPFAYLFNKYWPGNAPVSVFGHTAPPFELPPNFSFNSIGPFTPVGEWTTDVLTMLRSVPETVICFLMDDYWLNRQTDTMAVQLCYQYMLDCPSVGRFDLCTDRMYARGSTSYCKVGYLDVIKSDPMSPYHFSYQASLWRRETLIDCIAPHETPWASEVRGDERLRNTGALVLGTRQGPVRYTIAIQKGQFMPDGGYQTPDFCMNVEDVEYIRSQGWIPQEYLQEAR